MIDHAADDTTWLRSLCRAHRMTLLELSQQAGVSHQSLLRCDSGERGLNPSTRQTIKRFFERRRPNAAGRVLPTGRGYVVPIFTGWYVTPVKKGDFTPRLFKQKDHALALEYARNPVERQHPQTAEYAS